MKKIACLIIFLVQFFTVAWAQTFVVKDIRIEGLQGISARTVESYLPIKRGQVLRPSQTSAILKALYKTGFFENISLEKSGSTLVIYVVERPTIGQLRISGNSVIPTDKLNAVLKSLNVSEGRIYDPAILEKIKFSLMNQYYQLGRYNARVDISTTPMTRNRVLVKIVISEGLVAKITRISIIGNRAFDEETLVNQLDITTSGLFTVFTQKDRYSEARLEENVERLRNYYLDHGYLRVEVKAAQAQVTPDRKSVFVTFVVNEGEPYIVKDYRIEGDLIFPREEYMKIVTIKPGDRFSRQKILDTEKAVTGYLGSKGYMMANMSLRPEINDQDHTVILIFDVKPGKKLYVRRITFSENNRTNDVVLRREIQQMEAAPVSTAKLEDSQHRLKLLPYIKEAEMTIKPVPEVDDQIDINYKMKEDNSGQVSFKIGYSQAYHLILGAGLNQQNFLGTGNTLGINLSRSKYEQFYGIDYTDPYYTEDGISRSLNASISRVDPGTVENLNSGYSLNQYDLGVLYGIPIGQEVGAFNRIMLGLGYQNVLINLSRKPGAVSNQVLTFVKNHGRRFQEADVKIGYSRDSRDKAIFPTRGMLQSLFLDVYLPLDRASLAFYTLNYHGKWYQPITQQFIFLTKADFGYGNGFNGINSFPFFKNYYAGGIDSVRGFQAYTLGPRDSNNQAYGGNILMDASLALIFPNYFSDNLRTSAFVDAGNVYLNGNNKRFGGKSTNSGPIRYSVGVEADWITPFGPIELSLAKPFARKHDDTEYFQFALGANF